MLRVFIAADVCNSAIRFEVIILFSEYLSKRQLSNTKPHVESMNVNIGLSHHGRDYISSCNIQTESVI